MKSVSAWPREEPQSVRPEKPTAAPNVPAPEVEDRPRPWLSVRTEAMICPECHGHGNIRVNNMRPGGGGSGWMETCPACLGKRSVPSTQDLMERIDKVEAIVRAIAKDRRIEVDGL